MRVMQPLRCCFRAVFLLALVRGFAAGVISPAPGNFALDGAIDEWKGIPPHRTLKFGGDRRGSETIWIAQKRDGLVVAGQILGPGPEFAKTAAELLTKLRVEIWLSVVEPFDLPELPYDTTRCERPDLVPEQKKICLGWLQDQPLYRERLQRQFARMWRIAPAAAQESYALPAYDALSDIQRYKALPFFPRPAQVPISRFRTASAQEMSFEIAIPFSLFPPADHLNLESLQIAVNISSEFTGDLPGGEQIRESLPSVTLSPSIRSRITPCDQPLLGRAINGGDVEAFFFPTDTLLIDKVFFLNNPQKGDAWNPIPEPTEISPTGFQDTFTTQELGKGEYLCGPFMSYRRGDVVRHFPFQLRPPQDEVSHSVVSPFPVKKLADGTRLIRYGPDQSWSPLWRRSYIVYSMRIYAITPALEAEEVLHLGVWSDALAGYGIEISDDWRTVTEFRQKDGPWTSESFCLSGHTYRSCARNSNSRPPKEPLQDSNQ
jgi:hypothetical protein